MRINSITLLAKRICTLSAFALLASGEVYAQVASPAGVFKLSAAQEQGVNELLCKMKLEEKIGQLSLFNTDWDVTGPTMREGYRQDVKAGSVGAIFNAHTAAYNRDLQKIVVEETRPGIPLLFGYDVIHLTSAVTTQKK